VVVACGVVWCSVCVGRKDRKGVVRCMSEGW
jgi:hypothetical protein